MSQQNVNTAAKESEEISALKTRGHLKQRELVRRTLGRKLHRSGGIGFINKPEHVRLDTTFYPTATASGSALKTLPTLLVQ